MTTRITNHEEQAVDRLPSASRDGVEEGLVRIFARRTQTLEDVAVDVLTMTTLETATGASLDTLGRLVGEPRDGRADVEYRLRIRARVAINRSSGRGDELLRIVRLVVGPAAALALQEFQPAAFVLTISGTATALPDDVFALLVEAKAAGVHAFLRYQTTTDADVFTFQGGTGRGFGGTHPDRVWRVEILNPASGSAAPTLELTGSPALAADYRVHVRFLTSSWWETASGALFVRHEFEYRLGDAEPWREAYQEGDSAFPPEDYAPNLLTVGGTLSGLRIFFAWDEPYAFPPDGDEWRWPVAKAGTAVGGLLVGMRG